MNLQTRHAKRRLADIHRHALAIHLINAIYQANIRVLQHNNEFYNIIKFICEKRYSLSKVIHIIKLFIQ